MPSTKRLALGLLAVAMLLVALPSGAFAQAEDPDSYLFRYHINNPGDPLPNANGLGPFGSTTVGAGVQGDLFNPPAGNPVGLPENTDCNFNNNQVFFGATEWWRFHPHRNGAVTVGVQGNGFTPVIALMPVDAGENPIYNDPSGGERYVCIDGSDTTGIAVLSFPFLVKAGGTYAIQVGGKKAPNTAGGTPGTGTYSLQLAYDPDSDGDGLLDSADECDNERGSEAHKGCPDSDGDGIRDRDDACPTQSGPAQHQGCPDSDGDGIADRNDTCATLAGSANFGGCPDADGDGIPEGGADKCPTTNPARVNRNDKKPRDGCPDILPPRGGVSLDVGGTPNGIFLRSFAVTDVVNGARVAVKCKLPGGGKCGGVLVRHATTAGIRGKAAARRVKVKSLSGKRLPFGTKITVRITARFAAGKFIRLQVVNTAARIKRTDFCMKPNSKKLRKRGCV